MKRFLLPVFSLVFLFLVGFFPLQSVYADPLDDLAQKITILNTQLNESLSATKPLESQLHGMQEQIIEIKNRVSGIETDIVAKKKIIDTSYQDLVKKQELFNHAVRELYIQSAFNSPLLAFFASNNAQEITRILAYQKAMTDRNETIITNIALSITDLEGKKEALESEQSRLVTIKTSLDGQSKKLDKIVQGAKEYQTSLSGQIAQLSAQQQQLIQAKQASLHIPQSAYSGQGRSCVDDRSVSPGFSPAFAFFSYGVPNRVGLSQYGAWGRAKAGEDVEQILQDYYPGLTLKKDYDTGATISVTGYGSFNVEEYTKRIYEMPDSWTDHDSAALKAQAVASRSYGLAHRGGICTTESCQVFKPEAKGGNWDAAVNATKGWVLVDGSGNPVSTQYSSTHGGYILNIPKFDGTGGSPSSFSELNDRAYDKMSPWFYCDWGARPQYNKTAWLTSGEVADIVNIILLAKKDSTLGEHFYQIDTPPSGKDVWNADRVKSELQSRGATPFTQVTTASVTADFGGGKVSSITFSGDAGTTPSFSGQEFKDWFNLRAPANIQIVGPLYAVEQK